jgi:lipopolysaccharide/colanic/teichoic acid biosynthesis glycosyltransferase
MEATDLRILAPGLAVSPAREPHFGYDIAKRAIDIAGALVLLIVGTPVLALAACLIVLTSGWPPFIAQKRLGLGGREFTCWKLRTMVRNAEAMRERVLHLNVVDGPAFKHPRDPRLTWIGRWLRAMSIDELPQAINVLRGEMSLVGPRPLPVQENRYRGEQTLRLSVKPGLTCIWQVSGRSNVKFDQWMAMDVEYVRTRSIAKDIELIARTIPAVLTERGAA